MPMKYSNQACFLKAGNHWMYIYNEYFKKATDFDTEGEKWLLHVV